MPNQLRDSFSSSSSASSSCILPCDIWLRILQYCDVQTALTLSMVCKDIYHVVVGAAANWEFWQPLYKAKAYGDTHRVYQASGRSLVDQSDVLSFPSKLDMDGMKNFPHCEWNENEDFQKAIRMMHEINITGLWHLTGEHSTGRRYRYVLEMRQAGAKVYCVTVKPFISVGFGKLRGTMLTIKQFCKEPPQFQHQHNRRQRSYSPPGENAARSVRPRVGSVSLYRRTQRRQRSDKFNNNNAVDMEVETINSIRTVYNDSEHLEHNIGLPESDANGNPVNNSRTSGRDDRNVGRISDDRNDEEWEEMERTPRLLMGTGPWSHHWLMNFLHVDPEAIFVLPGVTWQWCNLCSAIVSIDGMKMRGTWIQEVSGVTLLEDSNTGWFEAIKVEKKNQQHRNSKTAERENEHQHIPT